MGSSDLADAVDVLNELLVVLPPEEQWEVERRNLLTASQWFLSVLFVRVLVFHSFLLSAQRQPGGITESTKRSWLLLQLSPITFFHKDLFSELVDRIGRHLTPAQLRELLINELDSLRQILGTDTTFFIALDEAQLLTNLYQGCFLSESKPRVSRPVIRPLVDTWSQRIPNIIISGTGLSMRSLESALNSVVAKEGDETITFTDLGAFESESSQRTYLEYYLPRSFLMTRSAKRLTARIGFWLHGRFVGKFSVAIHADLLVRHRFTASYLSFLVENCFESPHRVLDTFIYNLTQFRPSDADDIVEKQYQSVRKPRGFDFSRLREGMDCPTSCDGSFSYFCPPDEHLMHQIACCVFEYIFAGQPRRFAGRQAEALVEYGFARFQQTETGVVDEPIVLLAAADFFSKQTSWSMSTILSAGLTSSNPGERGFTFERFGAFLLATAFESQTPLSSVFDFVGRTKLHRESAHLVAINNGDKRRRTPVKISPPVRCNYILGQSHSSEQQTLDWLENPKGTALCFPVKTFGPDLILLLQLSDATVLRVLVQFKQITQRTIGTARTEEAIQTTDPVNFFSKREAIPDTDTYKCVLYLLASLPLTYHRLVARPYLNKKSRLALHSMAPRSDKAGDSSVLRVLISYPAKPHVKTLRQLTEEDKSKHPCAVVDLETLASIQGTDDILSSLTSMVTLKAQQRQSAVAKTRAPNKRKAGLALSDPQSTSSKRRK